jgi:small subunit ribosomal protein S16
MVVLRLSRGGAKARPFYNVVATDSRNRRDGRFIERLGFYNPIAAEGEQGLRLSLERIEYWRSHGAQVSPTVQRLVKQFAAKQATTEPAAAAA